MGVEGAQASSTWRRRLTRQSGVPLPLPLPLRNMPSASTAATVTCVTALQIVGEGQGLVRWLQGRLRP